MGKSQLTWLNKLLSMALLVFLVSACYPSHTDPVMVPRDKLSLKRGEQLVNGLATCGYCHGERPVPGSPLSGGRVFKDRYGEAVASNLTPSATGLKDWSNQEIISAIRAGTGKNGRDLSVDAHIGYEWLADYDVLAMIAYLRSVPPVDNETPERTVSFLERNTVGFFETKREVRGFIPVVDPKRKIDFGRYIVNHVSRCWTCHNSEGSVLVRERYLGGGKSFEIGGEIKVATDITGSPQFGIGTWSEAQIVKYLTDGTRPDGSKVDSRFCPTEFFARSSSTEKSAIAAYLLAVQ